MDNNHVDIYWFTVGLIFAAGLGFILGRIREGRARYHSSYRQMNRFSDAEQPGLTAMALVSSGIRGLFSCFIWSIILIIFMYLFGLYLKFW